MATLILAGEFVGPGERRAAEVLERDLPAAWTVITGKTLVRGDGSSRELDFIVVGRQGVYLIEEKSWGGVISGNENGWLVGGESRTSPLNQAEGQAKALAGWLRQRVPGLDKAVVGHFVAARVVLSAEQVDWHIHDRRAANAVLRLDSAAEQLQQEDARHPPEASIERFRGAIVKHLTGLPDRPKVPRVVGPYQVLELVTSPGPGRCLLARHEDGSLRLLRLVERPTTLIAAQRELAEAARKREYEALSLLAESGRAPRVDPYFAWHDDACWVFPVHPLAESSLQDDRDHGPPSPERVAAVFADAYTALAAVHQQRIVHRLLTPARVHLRADGWVMFSDFVLARIEGKQTVHEQVDAWDPDNAWRAPEVRLGAELATAASDVYSLALSLRYWLTGRGPAEDNLPVATARPDLPGSLSEVLDSLFSECLREDDQRRPSAAEVAKRLQGAKVGPTAVAEPLIAGQVIDERFTIRRELGRGATAIAYLADDADNGGQRVLKTLLDARLIERLATAEFRNLERIKNRHFPNIYAIKRTGHSYHLELEYIKGDPLASWMRDGGAQGDRAFCLRVAHDLAAALIELERHGILHRDLSPANILVPLDDRDPVMLIDLGLAAAAHEASSRVGTPRYLAPEADCARPDWSPRCDQYALGAVLFELYTGRLPYAHDGLQADKQQPAELSPEERGDRLLAVLLKAAAPDPAHRYSTAGELAAALHEAERAEPRPEPGACAVNPFVSALRGAYRNSASGNADNRALESDFARETYVATQLDRELLPQVLAGQLRLVILSGNPGDGKTAFLQTLRDALGQRGARALRDDEAGWRYELAGQRFAAGYDASESHGEQSADELFLTLLKPLAGQAEPAGGYTAAVAANDGRLIDFFERQRSRYGWLWSRLEPQLYGEGGAVEGVAVVDLKRRSLVDLEPVADSLYRAILGQFTRADRWEVCRSCAAREHCPIWFNACSLSAASGLPAPDRLARLLLAVHLQHERRPTLRDLRSALAWLLTSDLDCQAVHAELGEGGYPLAQTARLYYNAAFDGRGGPDLLLDEWQRLDPADHPAPRLDRHLYFHRGDAQRPLLHAKLQPPAARPEPPAPADRGQWLREYKRRWYFEVPEAPEIADRLPGFQRLLPYRYFEDYLTALRGGGDDDALRQRLLSGLSRADGAPTESDWGGLALRVSDSAAEDLVVVKQVPAEEFRLAREAPPPEGYLEDIPDELVLLHGSGLPRLRLGLDLFELLLRMADGYRPGAEEQGALLEDVAQFKAALLARPTQEVLLVEAGARRHRVKVVDKVITREVGA